MKKSYSVIILVSVAVLYSCSVLDSSYDPDGFYYQLKTDKNGYSLNDVVTYSFINTSNQNLYLFTIGCSLADFKKLEQDAWESVPIPIGCLGIERPPIKVSSGEAFKKDFDLNIFSEDELEDGTYRFDIIAGVKSGDEYMDFREVTTNNFEINK